MKPRWALRVFAACWVVYTVSWAPFIVREHYPALTLAERGSLNVERYIEWSDDIFQGPQGRAYINNNPGASLTAAIPLFVLWPLLAKVDAWNRNLPRPPRQSGEDKVFWLSVSEGRGIYFLLVGFVTVALLMAPATAATMAYLCSRLMEAGVAGRSAAAAALLCGLGTPLVFRAGLLNHNLLVADAGFVALLLLWGTDPRPVTAARALMAGLLAGYALLCDYSGVVVIAITAVYVWLRSEGAAERWRILAAFVAGMIPCAAMLVAYQAWAFGAFYLPSQHYMTPTAPTSHGYRGFDWPSPALAWALFSAPNFGLFAYCPALLLAFAAPFARRVKYRLPRREMWLLLAYFAMFVVFCSANQYSWLQPLTGFRYLVPIVPGLAVLAIQAAQALPRGLRIALAIASCFQCLAMAAAHENDLRVTLGALWERRFATLWMIRLSWAGMSPRWVTALGLVALAMLIAVLIQLILAFRTGRDKAWVRPA